MLQTEACTFLCDIQLITGKLWVLQLQCLTIIFWVVAPFPTYFLSYQLSFVICYICQWGNRKATILCSLVIHSCKKYTYMEHKEPIVLSRGLLWSVPRLTFNSFIMWASMYSIMSLCRMSNFVTMRLKDDREWFDGEEAEGMKGVTGCWSVSTKSKVRN